MTKTRVYLCWYSKNTIDFCHLSELAGIQPTKITKKGTPVVSHKDGSLVKRVEKDGQWATALHRENSLTYELPPYRGWKVYNLLNKMMKTIQHPAELGEYCKSNGINAHLEIVIYGITDNYSIPAFDFSKELVSFLATINASVDFDLYTSPLVIKELPKQ